MTTLTDAETEIVRLALRFPDSPGLVALAQGVMDGAASKRPERPTMTCTCGELTIPRDPNLYARSLGGPHRVHFFQGNRCEGMQ